MQFGVGRVCVGLMFDLEHDSVIIVPFEIVSAAFAVRHCEATLGTWLNIYEFLCCCLVRFLFPHAVLDIIHVKVRHYIDITLLISIFTKLRYTLLISRRTFFAVRTPV